MLAKISGGELNVSIKPRVYVTMLPEVLQELKAYVDHYGTEVSGCGIVEKYELKEKNNHFIEFRVTEVFLPSEQTNSQSSTDIDSKVIHSIMTDLLSQNKDTSKLKLHWHSHVDMGVFHSTTDKENYEELNNGDFLVSMVLNKRGDIFTSVHLYSEFGIDIKDVELYTMLPEAPSSLTEKIKSNIEKLDTHTKNNPLISYPATDLYGHSMDKWKNEKLSCEKTAGDYLGLSISEVNKFSNCRSTRCSKCKDEEACIEFNSVLANLECSYIDREAYEHGKACPNCNAYNYSSKAVLCYQCGQTLETSCSPMDYYD